MTTTTTIARGFSLPIRCIAKLFEYDEGAEVERIAGRCDQLGWGRPNAQQHAEIERLVHDIGIEGRHGVIASFNAVAQQGDFANPIQDAIAACRKSESYRKYKRAFD